MLEGLLEQKVRSMVPPARNLQDIKNQLLTSWCQILQGTFRGLVKSIPRWVRALLAACKGPTAYWAIMSWLASDRVALPSQSPQSGTYHLQTVSTV